MVIKSFQQLKKVPHDYVEPLCVLIWVNNRRHLCKSFLNHNYVELTQTYTLSDTVPCSNTAAVQKGIFRNCEMAIYLNFF